MPVTIFRILALGLCLIWAQPAAAVPQIADADNCELCHGLPLLSRFDDQGKLHCYEVSANRFSHTIHGTVACRDCHEDITTFPHELPVETVNCGKTCHVSRPFELTIFSHRDEMDAHAMSAHGFDPEDSDDINAAKPSCKYCHANRVQSEPTALLQEQARHCEHCHEEGGLTNVLSHVDRHLTHRNAENSLDIVRVCSSCHADDALMRQANVNPTQVSGFEHHFHGKAMKRGQGDVANCADCHTSHMVLSADDPGSSLSTSNIQNTCGSTNCHISPSAEFAASAVHSKPTAEGNPVVFYVEWGFILLTAGTMATLFAHILLDFGRYFHGRFIAGGRDD
jgi:hypothetical protein